MRGKEAGAKGKISSGRKQLRIMRHSLGDPPGCTLRTLQGAGDPQIARM